MSHLNKAMASLRAEYTRLQTDIGRVREALDALGRSNGGGSGTKRVLSKEARQRIADAQRKRWAKVRKAKLAKA